MIPTPDLAYVTTAQSNITSRFQQQNVLALVGVFADRWQSLENAAQAFLAALVNPSGALLDKLGALFNIPRNGLDDSDYLAMIRVQVLVYASNGFASELIVIAQQFQAFNNGVANTPTVAYYSFAAMTIDLVVRGIVSPNLLAALESHARLGGVHMVVSYDDVGTVFPSTDTPQPFIGDFNNTLGTTGLGYESEAPRYTIGSVEA